MAPAYPLLTSEQQRKLQSLGVLAVYLFGSHAEGRSHPLSDLDLGIVLDTKQPYGENLNPVYEALYDLFTDVFPDRPTDIVFLQRAGLEIAIDAIFYGEVLFEASAEKRVQFEEGIMLLYADFKPVLDQFDAAVLGRIR